MSAAPAQQIIKLQGTVLECSTTEREYLIWLNSKWPRTEGGKRREKFILDPLSGNLLFVNADEETLDYLKEKLRFRPEEIAHA